MKIILQKLIADSGLCSRRRAEDLIRLGRVKVNGAKAEPGMKAGEGDEIEVDGKELNLKKNNIYIKLNKPIGYTCTNRKFRHEKNVFELVDVDERLFVVGRLDKNSRGLVLLTNDGDWAQKLSHPRYEHEKEYVVIVKSRKLKVESVLEGLSKGVDIGDRDGEVKAKRIEFLGNNKFKIILTEGKKRQIRRMFSVLGYAIEDLERVRIGNISLGDLKEGEWEEFNGG